MNISIDNVLEVLSAYDIEPHEQDIPTLPDVGTLEPGETIYATSADGPLVQLLDDPRLHQWTAQLEDIILAETRRLSNIGELQDSDDEGQPALEGGDHEPSREAPEPTCAWYCPIHYFGHAWGIYIREACILSTALQIARFVDWPTVNASGTSAAIIAEQLLKSAFYTFFLHEQFHHKVESLGFRLLVATGSDRYLRYKANVYRPFYNTVDCLEESLANAESYLRLSEERYVKRLTPPFRGALRDYLKRVFALQPPGYAQALSYLTTEKFGDGQDRLQSLIRDGTMPPGNPDHWLIATHVIRALMNIEAEIYVILPVGARPLFAPSTIDPGATVSTNEATKGLIRYHGYCESPGGKGSHVKLTKAGCPPIILTGNQPALSPGVLRDVMRKLGGHPLSRARAVLQGR